ncbi:MAG TPA: nucleoside triphosphate pyrophosphatase [Anaeromyxobacteraceae bacterium]|nr:nucleoside triphosphate pyrophosphatase [Anaeromyxobacteraceae bacterium]
MPPPLTLASASPRRREMLAQLGFALRIRPAETDETVHAGEGARDYVRRVAREKARAVEGDFVLGADTAVILAGRVLGKPAGPAEAARMLRELSGTAHEVLTGVCLRRVAARIELEALVSTEVVFAPLGEAEIAWYVATGEPLDKAGAYAIQGAGGAFVREVRGSVSNVVGLPLAETAALLRRAGYPLPWEAP